MTLGRDRIRFLAAASRSPARWAGAVLVPFLALAARIAAYRGHVYQTGDFALLDLGIHRAARWHQLLGPYDRFGWRHPGPAYLYLVSFVARVVGPSHGLQAQTITATLVDGLALAGVVLVLGRLGGPRATVLSAAVGAAMVVGIGTEVMFNPWNPYVVVLPLTLLGVLAVASARGSVSALVAVVLVATFTVQTDLGCVLLAAVLSGGAAAGFAWRRLREKAAVAALPRVSFGQDAEIRAGRSSPTLLVGVGVMAVLIGLAWGPVFYQELTGSPGNLSAVASFFRHPHAHAGVVAGVRAAGVAEVAVIGVRPRMLPSTGPAGLIYCAAGALVAGAVIVAAVRRVDRLAAGLGIVAAAGVVAAATSGVVIVGPTYAYLLTWAAAPAMVGGIGAALVATGRPGIRFASRPARLAPEVVVLAAIAVSGLLARALFVPEVGHYSDRGVAAAWSGIAADVRAQPIGTVGLWFVSPTAWAIGAGLADELDSRGVPFTVLPRWSFQFGSGHSGSASRWVLVVDPGTVLPPGYRVVARAGDVVVADGTAQPSTSGSVP